MISHSFSTVFLQTAGRVAPAPVVDEPQDLLELTQELVFDRPPTEDFTAIAGIMAFVGILIIGGFIGCAVWLVSIL